MNRKTLFQSAIVVLVLFGLWLALHQRPVNINEPPATTGSPTNTASETTSQKTVPKAGQDDAKSLEAIFAKTIDPAYAKYRFEQEKTDPSFDWKQPINFYGRVVDASNAVVVGASIHFTWNDNSENGTSEANTVSDNNGGFSLTDRRGKRLYVAVGKEGYYSSGNSRGAAFEYANPFDGLFRPDSMNPVVFHLRKKGIGADLIHGSKLLGSRIEGTLSYVNLTEGKNSLTPPGDLTVQFTRSEKNADKKFDWTIKLGVVGGGLIESTDEFMFLAPEDGYLPTVEISHKATDSDWVSQEKHKFYIKSQDGKHYARIEITIIPDYNQTAAYDLNWYLNPNGSRNLEPK